MQEFDSCGLMKCMSHISLYERNVFKPAKFHDTIKSVHGIVCQAALFEGKVVLCRKHGKNLHKTTNIVLRLID